MTVIVPDESPEEIQTFVDRLHCMSMNSDVSEACQNDSGYDHVVGCDVGEEDTACVEEDVR